MAADLVRPVAEAVGVRVGAAGQEQPRGLDRGARQHDVPAEIVRRSPVDSSTTSTPVTVPDASVRTSSARARVTRSHPAATASGRTVLYGPFLASLGHANPTHSPHCTHRPRPPRGTELISIGTGPVVSPSRSAPRRSTCASVLSGSGGIG